MTLKLDPIEDVIADVRNGKMIVMVDDADRENEGDLMVAAEKVSQEAINFMMQYGRGLICVSLTEQRLRELDLPYQVQHNTSPFGTNFAISFDHKLFASTGNTAEARAEAIKAAASEQAKPEDFIRPGHVFPLGAVAGGVLKRRGQTEGTLDISRLAGLAAAGVNCEIMDESGEMLRGVELEHYCREHNLKITSVEEIVNYIVQNEVALKRMQVVELNSFSASLSDLLAKKDLLEKAKKIPIKVVTYSDYSNQSQHYALVVGNNPEAKVLVHRESIIDDIFFEFLNKDSELEQQISSIIESGSGVLIYLRESKSNQNKIAPFILRDLNSYLN